MRNPSTSALMLAGVGVLGAYQRFGNISSGGLGLYSSRGFLLRPGNNPGYIPRE